MSAYLDKPCRSLREVILTRVGTPGRLTMAERIDQLAFLLAYECGSPQGIISAVTRTTADDPMDDYNYVGSPLHY